MPSASEHHEVWDQSLCDISNTAVYFAVYLPVDMIALNNMPLARWFGGHISGLTLQNEMTVTHRLL